MQHAELVPIFLIIALIYSSAGFGGGSSYIAVLALYALPFKELRLTALLCNIVVVSGGVYIYLKNERPNWKKISPLVLLSVPMSYLGARLTISQGTFYILLGFSLVTAGILLWFKTCHKIESIPVRPARNFLMTGAALGGTIGLLSGMLGIGGGIFLAPVLNLIRWDQPKRIAATASLFILANSFSGIQGQLVSPPQNINYTRIALLCLAVFAGGQLGSRIAIKYNPEVIVRITSVLVVFAGTEVLIKHL